MKTFGLTDKGAVRRSNQDCFIIEKCDAENCYVFALCDGMGGENAGDLASRLSAKAFMEYVYGKLSSRTRRRGSTKELLLQACTEANGVAWEYSRFDIAYTGMGTTIVGGIVGNNGRCGLVNVGDSRAYVVPARQGMMTQITQDHSLVADLITAGIITQEEAKTHPQRNVITRALGSEETIEADYYEFDLHTGDFLMVCSDGLYNTLSQQEIQQTIRTFEEPEAACRQLMKLALEAGARDNVTVILIRR